MMRSLISYCLVQWLDVYIRLKIDKRALVQSLIDEQKPLAQEWAKWSEGGDIPGLLEMETTSTGEAPTQAAIRWWECKLVMIDRIMKVGMLKQALHKEAMSPSMGLDITFGSRTLFLSRIVDEVLVEAAVRNVRQWHKVSKCSWENSADKYITHRGTTNLQFAKNKQTNKKHLSIFAMHSEVQFLKKKGM